MTRPAGLRGRLTRLRTGFASALRGVAALPGRLRRRWAALPPLWRHFTVDVAIGIAIEAAILLGHASSLVAAPDDTALDAMIRALGPSAAPAPGAPAFVFVDIDDASWQAWGDPLVTPRDRLRAMLAQATAAGAAAVVVDVSLVRSGAVRAEERTPADDSLRSWLARYDGPTPIVLARALEPSGDGLPALRRSFLEADGSRPRVTWATVGFSEDGDGIVRRWRLWERACDAGQPVALPSVQLAVLALRTGAGARAALDDALATRVGRQGCSPDEPGASAAGGGHESPLTLGPHRLTFADEPLAQRIRYAMPWRLAPGDAYREVALPDGRRVPRLVAISAAALADAAADSGSAAASAALLAGRVVVIGGSLGALRDVFRTPLGPMPGALILANSIASLAEHGQMRHPPVWFEVLMIVAGSGLVAWLFVHLHRLPAALLSFAGILALTLAASWILFRGAVWFSFALPLLGVQVHSLLADVKDWGGLVREGRAFRRTGGQR